MNGVLDNDMLELEQTIRKQGGLMNLMVSKRINYQRVDTGNHDNESRDNISIIFLLIPKASVAFLTEHCTLRQGLEKMKHHGYAAIPVVADDGTYVGTVSEGDFLWSMMEKGACSMKAKEEHLISDILRKDWNPAATIDTTMAEMLKKVVNQNFVPVVDDRGKFVGIITRKDVLKYYHQLELV